MLAVRQAMPGPLRLLHALGARQLHATQYATPAAAQGNYLVFGGAGLVGTQVQGVLKLVLDLVPNTHIYAYTMTCKALQNETEGRKRTQRLCCFGCTTTAGPYATSGDDLGMKQETRITGEYQEIKER